MKEQAFIEAPARRWEPALLSLSAGCLHVSPCVRVSISRTRVVLPACVTPTLGCEEMIMARDKRARRQLVWRDTCPSESHHMVLIEPWGHLLLQHKNLFHAGCFLGVTSPNTTASAARSRGCNSPYLQWEGKDMTMSQPPPHCAGLFLQLI